MTTSPDPLTLAAPIPWADPTDPRLVDDLENAVCQVMATFNADPPFLVVLPGQVDGIAFVRDRILHRLASCIKLASCVITTAKAINFPDDGLVRILDWHFTFDPNLIVRYSSRSVQGHLLYATLDPGLANAAAPTPTPQSWRDRPPLL